MALRKREPPSPCPPLPPCPCPRVLAAHVLEQPRRGEGFVCSRLYPPCWWGFGGQWGRGTPRSWGTGDPCRWHSQTRLAAARALPAPGEAANKSWCLERQICFFQQLCGMSWKCLWGLWLSCVRVGEQQVLGWLLASCWGVSGQFLSQGSVSLRSCPGSTRARFHLALSGLVWKRFL